MALTPLKLSNLPALSGVPDGAEEIRAVKSGADVKLTLDQIKDFLQIDAGTWTPTATFTTPGDISVAYATQIGHYVRVGQLLALDMEINFTPTFSTSSGTFVVEGFPYAALAPSTTGGTIAQISSSGWVWPAGATAVTAALRSSGLGFVMRGIASGVATLFNDTHLTSGVAHVLAISFQFKVAA